MLKYFVGEILPKLLNELLPILWIVLLVISIKPVIVEFNNGYLSKKNCNQLRGFLALTILLYHISQKIETGILLPWFSTFGYLAVSVFYFLSGYGLQKSYKRKKDYKDWFLLKRLPKVVVPYMIAIILFWIMNNCLLGNDLRTKDVIQTFISGHPIVTYSWYIISILNYYVMFCLLMKICGNNKLIMLIGACVWHMAYIFLCRRMGYSTWWYSDGHLLIIGMAWAAYEDQILKYFRKYYRIVLPLVIVFLIPFHFIRSHGLVQGGVYYILLLTVPVLVILFVNSILLKTQFKSAILEFLGQISLEIYLVQGLAIQGLRNEMLYIRSDFVWCVTVIMSTIAIAVVLHIVSSRLLDVYKRFLGKLPIE